MVDRRLQDSTQSEPAALKFTVLPTRPEAVTHASLAGHPLVGGVGVGGGGVGGGGVGGGGVGGGGVDGS